MEKILLSLLLVFAPMTSAFELEDRVIGIGNLTQFIGKVQQESGSERRFDFNPYLSLSASMKIRENISFSPEIGVTLPSKTRDENVSRWTYFLMGTFGYSYMDWVFRAGAGLSYTRLSGDGGTAEVANGLGTDNFFLPSENSISSNIIATLGAEYYFHADWSTRLDTHIFNTFSSRNRAFSYTGSLHYHFGGWGK